MRLLVCGGRDLKDAFLVATVLNSVHKSRPITVLIEGEACGADTMARMWAETNGIPVEKYPADWRKHGNAAGPVRNKQMLAEGKPDMVLAFPGGRGTRNMVAQATAANLKIISLAGTGTLGDIMARLP